MIHSIVTHVMGLLVASTVILTCLALFVSMPVVFSHVLAVTVRREWIPLVYNLRSIARRKVAALATLFGLGLVVFVLTATLMLAAGIRHTLVSTGDPRNAKVFLKGISFEGQSYLNQAQLNLLSVAPGIAKGADGKPLLSPELLILVWASAAGDDPAAGVNLSLRGVSSRAYEFYPPRRLDGRRPSPGALELVIGKSIEGRFKGATLGGTMQLAGYDWKVVGVADHAGTAHDSEAWADLDHLRGAFRRDASVVNLVLADSGSIAELEAIFSVTPALRNLQIRRETEYWESLGRRYVDFVKLVGCLVGAIFGLAAILGAMNTMYAQVAARTRELGALRAIGFRPRAILSSLVLESSLLGFVAGAIGVGAASLLSGVRFQLTSEKTLTEVSYGFHFSTTIALSGLFGAAMLGYAGGLLPALRAARLRIVDAVRAD